MPSDRSLAPLIGEIESTLDLLAEFQGTPAGLPAADPLPSLLAQCESLVASAPGAPVLRCIHHFACTGGTLISKVLATLPGAQLLSEIDPLSRMGMARPGNRQPFAPTDLLLALRHSLREVPQEMLADVFLAAVTTARDRLAAQGQRLILRDHAHSQFCTTVDPQTRPSLHEILAPHFDLRAVVTLRHPLESFLSLEKNGWQHFTPFTLEEYSRRYLLFLDRHRDLPWIRYEDFTADPESVLHRLCTLLDLPFSALALDLFSLARISGDSGRTGPRITPRPPKPVPEDMKDQVTAASYRQLCARMGYTENTQSAATTDPTQQQMNKQQS